MDFFIKSIKKLTEPYKKCEKCRTTCDAIRYQRNFENWTSGNEDIDKFIQDTQLSHNSVINVLEWIPYDRLHNIKGKKFSEVYRANWIDGNISHWSSENENWERENHNMFVILKSLNNPNNILMELENEVL
jgi:hypothetical protein